MAQIYNTDLSKELIQGASIQVNRDLVPNQLAEKVVPVMEVNPKLLRYTNVMKTGAASNATSATIYTTPATQDFYLTSAFMSLVKDVTATNTSSRLNATLENGDAVIIISIELTTLTIEKDNVGMAFAFPIKLRRNSSIVISQTTNVANSLTRGIISGYIVDNPIN